MKLLCKLFGHKLDFNPAYDVRPHCMKLEGYTVEKEPVYLLKHIDMSKEDSIYDWYVYRDLDDNRLWHASLSKGYDMSKATIYHFTQAEIEKLHTGSYEQIEVIK